LGDFSGADITTTFSDYSMVSLANELYLFGGLDDYYTDLDTCYKFRDPDWTKIGHMMAGRRGHRSIATSNSIIHIGGYNDQ